MIFVIVCKKEKKHFVRFPRSYLFKESSSWKKLRAYKKNSFRESVPFGKFILPTLPNMFVSINNK